MRRFAIGIAVTLVSVILLYFAIDWSTTFHVLRSARWGFVVLAVGCLLLSLAAKTTRWQVLLPRSAGLSWARLFRILHISYLLNNVLPARLGDVARVGLTTRQPGLRIGHVVSSLLTERVADIVVLLGAFLAVSPFLRLEAQYRHWLDLAWLVSLILLIAVVLAALFQQGIVRSGLGAAIGRRIPGGHWIRDEAGSFMEGWRSLYSRRRALPVWGWSGVAWVLAFGINFLLMKALRIEAPFTVAILLTCTTNLSMLIPSSPGYIGVFHAAATLSLLPFNVGGSVALSFAVLAHLVNVVPVSFLGALFLLLGHETGSLGLKKLEEEQEAVRAVEAEMVADHEEPAPIRSR